MTQLKIVTFSTSDERGHNDFIEINYEQLNHQRAVELVTHPSSGAISTFVGTTRDNFQGKKIVRLEYEGYTPMAVSELRKICDVIREKWPDVVGVALFHRLGIVQVAEASVIVAVSSPHRREALEACAFAIDTIKATVPLLLTQSKPRCLFGKMNCMKAMKGCGRRISNGKIELLYDLQVARVSKRVMVLFESMNNLFLLLQLRRTRHNCSAWDDGIILPNRYKIY